jgi:hypothetical protein
MFTHKSPSFLYTLLNFCFFLFLFLHSSINDIKSNFFFFFLSIFLFLHYAQHSVVLIMFDFTFLSERFLPIITKQRSSIYELLCAILWEKNRFFFFCHSITSILNVRDLRWGNGIKTIYHTIPFIPTFWQIFFLSHSFVLWRRYYD